MTLVEELAEANPDALLADGLEAALVGYTINTNHPHVAVYDAGKCVEVLVERDGLTHEEAEEYLEHNTFCAYVGHNGPLYIRTRPIVWSRRQPPATEKRTTKGETPFDSGKAP